MHRVAVPRTPARRSARRRSEEADEQRYRERPEIRRDIRKTWWPDAADGPDGPGTVSGRN
jgi:hypothetical protein